MADRERDILELIGSGKKIEAIKLAREHLGMSLAEAKAFVEGLEADREATEGRSDEATAGWDEVDALLRARRKIDAVRAYRAGAGCGLKEAKDAVEARAVAIGLQSRPSKCFVATAACGGGEQADVVVLRRWRNRVLRRVWWGRVAIGVYEWVAPPVAWVVGRSGAIAWCVRGVVTVVARGVRSGGG